MRDGQLSNSSRQKHRYNPLQNREAFGFFDPIVGKNAAIYHTAGVLGEGERVWILAKLPECIRVTGNDVVDKYLLLCNSHDGNSAVQIKFTPVRVVCQNTLNQALGRGRTIRVAHTRSMRARMRNAEQLLGIIRARYEQIGKDFMSMARVRVSAERLDEYLRQVFPEPEGEGQLIGDPRVARNRALARHLFEQGRGNREGGSRGSLWAAYNGVTELVDHRDTNQSADRRLNSVWFGNGHLVKTRAFAVAKELMRVWAN